MMETSIMYAYKVRFFRYKKARQNLRINHIMYMILLYYPYSYITRIENMKKYYNNMHKKKKLMKNK